MIERIEALLAERIGLHVPSIGRSAVERAVRMRMRDAKLSDEQAYWRRLSAEAAEQQALIDAVVVPETCFFRYPESFDALAAYVAARRDAAPLRVLSLPCATGEEPYSIAMTMLDAGAPPAGFQIDALDISPRLLRFAGEGRYAARAFRGSEAHCAHHYAVEAGEHVLSAAVRDRVAFRSGNVLDTMLPTALGAAYDIVFCRNLLIYFDAPTRTAAIAVLKRLLRPDGVLFVAPAEASLMTDAGLESVGPRSAVMFAHRRAVAVAPAERKPARLAERPRAETRRPAPRPRAALPAMPEAAVVAPPSDDLLTSAVALAEAGQLREAREAFEQVLVTQGPSATVYFWLGLLNDQQSKAVLALDYYRKALYLDPAHVDALGHLAALLDARGDHAGARALRLRAGLAEAEGGAHGV